jgi:SHS2 domain-containing protein
MAPYDLVDHTADLGIVVRGETLEDLFVEAGRALFDLLVEVRNAPAESFSELIVKGKDLEDLMVNWLRELLYLFNGEEKVVSSVEMVRMEATLLEARLGWFHVFKVECQVLSEIKAVTYHQIRVEPKPSGFEAQVIFDT